MGAEKNGSRNTMRVLWIIASALTGTAVILWVRRMGFGLIYAYAGLLLLFAIKPYQSKLFAQVSSQTLCATEKKSKLL